jgi:hypothetical protein
MQTSESAAPLSPFTIQEAWVGVAYLIIWVVVSSATSLIPIGFGDYFGVIFLVMQVGLLLPVGVIAVRRKLNWHDLGLRKFERSAIAFGCVWLLMVYGIVIVHNLILISLNIDIHLEDCCTYQRSPLRPRPRAVGGHYSHRPAWLHLCLLI